MLSTLRHLYNKYLRNTFVHGWVSFVLNVAVAGYGRLVSFYFPPSYLRCWKLDMLWGRYERDTVALFKKIIKPGMVIVDIGAHIGYYTRIFARLAGSTGAIYAFEADPENFALLDKNTAHLRQVKLFSLAVSNRVGSIDFYHSEDKTGCHSTIPADFRQKRITVSATDLDSILTREGVRKVDVIKMDIEGGEAVALQGMRCLLAANPKIALITEFNPECLLQAKLQPVDFLREISALGLKIFNITTGGLVAIIVHDTSTTKDFLFGSHFVNIYCTKALPSA